MKYILILFLTLSAIGLNAQNVVKMSAVKGNNYGIAYSLPKTAIKVTVKASKTVREAGEFYQYAERFLNISNPITKNEILYTLDNVETELEGIPDKEHSYLVEFRSNAAGPFVSLTEDGLICAVNADYVFPVKMQETVQFRVPEMLPDPRGYLSEEILRAGSTSKQAELIAKQIFLIRETRNNILIGEADNMPPDGEAYKIVMERLDLQEKSLTSMFAGTEHKESTIKKEFIIIPDENNIEKDIIFRFSGKLGIVDSDNLAGAPVFLSLTNKESKKEVFLSPKEQKAMEKKFESGIIYNIPGKADLKIEYNNKTLSRKVCDIVQFGTKDVLTPKELEYKKNEPVKIIFYPLLGAIKEISR